MYRITSLKRSGTLGIASDRREGAASFDVVFETK